MITLANHFASAGKVTCAFTGKRVQVYPWSSVLYESQDRQTHMTFFFFSFFFVFFYLLCRAA